MPFVYGQPHDYRQHWDCGGEAKLPVHGDKLELTTIPDKEWKAVGQNARKFWDEIAKTSPRNKRVIDIRKQYTVDMEKAGKPYRYS